MQNRESLKDFLQGCRDVDFSEGSMEKNWRKLKDKLGQPEKERETIMKKTWRKPVAAAAVLCLMLSGSLALYGEEFFRIIKEATLGAHASYAMVDDQRQVIPVPEELKGKIFDAEGKAIENLKNQQAIYNAQGEKVVFEEIDGVLTMLTPEEHQQYRQGQEKEQYQFDDFEEAAGYFITDVALPSYLPAGFVFDRAEFYGNPKDAEAVAAGGSKYMGVYFTNGTEELYSQIRYMDEETAFSSSSEAELEKIDIQGYEAVVHGNSVDIQIGDVMYMFFGQGKVSAEDLIKMAESLVQLNQ